MLSGHGSFNPYTESLFLYNGAYVYSNTRTKYLKTPNAGDVWNRLYYVEEGGGPRYYAEGGVAVSYKLGLPRPASFSTAINDHGDSSNALTEHFRSYVVAWVDQYGHLGPTSEVGVNILDEAVYEGAEVLVGRPPIPAGEYAFGTNAKWRIYRSNTSNAGQGVFQFVADVPLSTVLYYDNMETGNLQEAQQSSTWEAPPALEDMVAMSGGYFAGFKGNALYFSEPYLPHAWPYTFSYTENIVGISVIDSGLLVLTDDKPYLMVGTTPASMARVDLRSDQSCVSKNSIVDMGGATMFASTDGLCIAYGTEVKVLTEELLHRDDWWTNYDPANINALAHEGRYETETFSFDPKGGLNALVSQNQEFRGHYRDGTSDQTFVINGAGIPVGYKTGAALDYRYKTKIFEYPRPVNFGFIRIAMGAGTVTMVGYGDGEEIFRGVISASGTYKLPAGFKCRYYELEFSGSASISKVLLKTSSQGG